MPTQAARAWPEAGPAGPRFGQGLELVQRCVVGGAIVLLPPLAPEADCDAQQACDGLAHHEDDGERNHARPKRPAQEQGGDTDDERRPRMLDPPGHACIDDHPRDTGEGHGEPEQAQDGKVCLGPVQDIGDERSGRHQDDGEDDADHEGHKGGSDELAPMLETAHEWKTNGPAASSMR